MNLLFDLSYLRSNFAPTLGYILNPALNKNPAQGSADCGENFHWGLAVLVGLIVKLSP